MNDEREATLGDMDKEARDELFEQQTSKQYAAIGRFVVEFESACSALRMVILSILQCDGLRTQRLGQILLDNKYMTAAPLVEAFDAILTESGRRQGPIQIEILNQVSSEFRCLTKERNIIVHGQWFIGYANSESTDFSKIAGLKGAPSKKKGMNFKELPNTFEEINNLLGRVQCLNKMLKRIHVCLFLQTSESGKDKFEKNFSKVGDGWTDTPPKAKS